MTLSSHRQLTLCVILYTLTSFLYTIFSFSLTDPNLVFTQWPPFWAFQQTMWQLPKHTITWMYVGLILTMFVCNFWLYFIAKKITLSISQWLLVLICIVVPLLFSNNALSHDVFNYIFNARMVVKYQVNPHVRVAMDFMYDPWTRFMHNVHTPAPYFYGWTALSLIPYLLGFEKFVLTWLIFRLWSFFGLLLSFYLTWWIGMRKGKVNWGLLVLTMFNPLLLIELVSNSHNDGWLIWPAMASFLVITNKKMGFSLLKTVGSLLFLLFSMSTKYATAILLPIWSFAVVDTFFHQKLSVVYEKFKFLTLSRYDFASILLFLPLFSVRSQQFNPWYLSWSLLFFPLMENRFLRACLIVLSVSSLLRYVPWMWNGGFSYTPEILLQQKMLTWIPVTVFACCWILITSVTFIRKHK